MDPSYVRADPARIAAGAITGVGFIGAGVVLENRVFDPKPYISRIYPGAFRDWSLTGRRIIFGSDRDLLIILSLALLRHSEPKTPSVSLAT